MPPSIIPVTKRWLSRRRHFAAKGDCDAATFRGTGGRPHRYAPASCRSCGRPFEIGSRVVSTGLSRKHSYRCVPCAVRYNVITEAEAAP